MRERQIIELHSCINTGDTMRVWTLLLRKRIQKVGQIHITFRCWKSLVIKGSVREREEKRDFVLDALD